MPMTLDDWLDACADRPDDDLTRFAFADWLEERGDTDRATFIRLRVGLSRLSEDQHALATVKAAEALLESHLVEWLGPLVEVAESRHWEFPRGLPEALVLLQKGWGDAGALALAGSPNLAGVILLDLGWNTAMTTKGKDELRRRLGNRVLSI